MAQDLYSILGVSRSADKEEIKQAYRKLARKLHPDINKEPGAEERFKEINRAYEVLSDEQTRARYDRFGEQGIGTSAASAGGDYGGGVGDFGDFSDLFEAFGSMFGGGGFGGAGGRRPGGPQRGDDRRVDVVLSFTESVFGVEKELDVQTLQSCGTCQGTGAKPGTKPSTCGTCAGAGQVRQATRTPFGTFTQVATCPECRGSGQVVTNPCADCGGKGRKVERKNIEIQVPCGVDNNTRLRVGGKGDIGVKGGPAGDLYVFIAVEQDLYFKRDGQNLYSEVEISYLQAILGSKVKVKVLDFEQKNIQEKEIDVVAGTQPGRVITLEKQGVPRPGNPMKRGDHLITLRVAIPQKVSREERDLLEKLAHLHGEKVKKDGIEGFFSNLFGHSNDGDQK
jgi:molecular chaperone DnaJ